ncbi:acyltransferase [Frankia sp. Cppng1_Ct_nod]|uniref:acyltransferase n=1 Tax=Frankia sp. Cppng1_Ct_nod TaxID=2897162 RepID=UPI001F5FB553|nr:acyltransferase [Frankia sp. Cppng1_Ct_nod]
MSGPAGGNDAAARRINALKSVLDPRPYAHMFRILHFYAYSHTRQKVRLTLGSGVRLAPNVSIRNGERISIADHAHIGERSYLWAGNEAGRIDIGEYALFGPEVFVTASDYQIAPDVPVMHQPKRERDVRIGRDVWLGARVVVTAGVEIGDGCIVGAGSVVTRSLPPGSIAVGAPARVVGKRSEHG